MNKIDAFLWLLMALTVACIGLLLLIGLVLRYGSFTRELRRLNNEIGRTYGTERKRWLRRRRRLWMSLLPFVRY